MTCNKASDHLHQGDLEEYAAARGRCQQLHSASLLLGADGVSSIIGAHASIVESSSFLYTYPPTADGYRCGTTLKGL
jgi:precorrin-4 methylase